MERTVSMISSCGEERLTRCVGKGLASHLQVPLPYLLYRAQVRYEEDLRGLRTALSPVSPAPQASTAKPGSPPVPAGGEYFPRIPTQDQVAFPRRDSLRTGNGPLSASTSGRPLAIRTRLNSLGNVHRSINSPQKVTSSSVITLQGPERTYAPLRPLSPTSSRPSPSSPSSGADGGDEDEEEEEEMRRNEEEEEKRLEEQQTLDRKLRELEQKLTKESIGLVSSPPRPSFSRREVDRGRMHPLSSSSVSSSLHQRLDFSRRHSASHTPSHHSLSSTSSAQGSIPDIPSPPSEASQPSSPISRHLSPPGPSRSPPTVSHGNAFGTVRGPSVYRRPTLGGNVRSERGSEIGSAASSFSDLSGQYSLRQCTHREG